MSDVFAAEEADRLAALAEYGLLDTPPEHAIDRLTRLAAHIFDVPVVTVSLVDKHRQFLKSRVGLDVAEAPLSDSFCKEMLHLGEPLVVPDTLQHARFCRHPMVTGGACLRFFAGVPLWSASGQMIGGLCIMDVRARSDFGAEEQAILQSLATMVMDHFEMHRLRTSRRGGAAAFDAAALSSPDAVLVVDEQARIVFWNDGAAQLFGHSSQTVVGQNISTLFALAGRHAEADTVMSAARCAAEAASERTFEFVAMHISGRDFPGTLAMLPLFAAPGVSAAASPDMVPARVFAAVIRDMTVRREAEAALYRLADIDALTDMVNRDTLVHLLSMKVAAGMPLDLLLIDLNNFKIINDTWGHETGDRVMSVLAHRVRRVVSDLRFSALTMASGQTPGLFPGKLHLAAVPILGCLARDVFAIALPQIPPDLDRSEVCLRLIANINESIDIDGQWVSVNASVGLAAFPGDACSVADLLANADLALYQAQADGPNCHRFFVPDLREAVVERRILERELCLALDRGQLELFYQPQVDLITGAVLGAEALLRWRHPVRGLLTPSDFMDVLETSSVAAAVGQCIIETACAQAACWRAVAGFGHFQMSVNLFGRQIISGHLFSSVMEPIQRHGLQPSAIEIEITETTILRRDDIVLTPLRELCKQGVRIAFDDYGTGYASLSLLKNFPLTRLKIDKSFVEHLDCDDEDAAVVQAIIFLAHNFGLRVIAEGVETEGQAQVLREKGCREAQGYLYSRPVPAAEFEKTFLGGAALLPCMFASVS